MTTKKEPTSHETQTPKKTQKFTIPLPVFSFRQSSANGLLVFSLVIFSFLLGMLTNKVIYLQQQVNNPPVAPTQQQAAAPTPPPVVKNLSAGKLPVMGSKNAKVTLVEFSDFQCPFCKKLYDESEQQIIDKYVKTGKIKFAYRHFPLSSIHPNAEKSAEASECANEQGKFWEFHDLLFQNQDTWAPKAAADATADWNNFAGELGLNTDQFQTCLSTDKYKQRVADDATAGSNIQVDATPTFFVNGVRMLGAVPFSDIQKTIEQELKK
jgi:protein-disulfide isomerase